MIRAVAIIFALLMLSGCEGGGVSAPAPSPPQPPSNASEPVVALPGRRKVFSADWSGPSIGLGLACTEDTPPVFTAPPECIFATFDRPGLQGRDCVDPGPNPGYHVEGGKLIMTPGVPGYLIISAQTFPKDGYISIEAELEARSILTEGCGGIVLYNGEANYRAIYLSPDATVRGSLSAGMWSTSHRVDFPGLIEFNEKRTVRIDYEKGFIDYYVDGRMVYSEGPTTAKDPSVMAHDPRLALFAGGITLVVGRVEVFVDDV